MSKTPHWFYSIKDRCTRKKCFGYPNYGGRGIQYRIPSYQALIDAIGEKPKGYTLDRIDNNGHYEIGNLRWATYKEQSANKRPPKMHIDNQVGIKGISVEQPSGRRKKIRYLVQITKDGKRYKLYNGVSLDKAKEALVGHNQ